MLKPGDEVVCVDDAPRDWRPVGLTRGEVYVVECVHPFGAAFFVTLCGEVAPHSVGWWSDRFRKVQKRNDRLSIESFMTMPGGFEEPRRPAKTKEKKDA